MMKMFCRLAGGEGVDLRVAHQLDMHRLRIEARRLGQRRLIAFQHVLGFGVAQQRDALRIGRRAAEAGEGDDGRDGKAGREGDPAG